MVDFVIIAVVAVLLGAVGGYIYKEKKRGSACIGCPHAKTCGGHCSGSCESSAHK